jgi:aminopeptidase N
LPKLTEARDDRELLEELLDDRDPMLRLDVARALLDLGDPRARGALRARESIEDDVRVRRRIREVLRDLGADKKASHAEIDGELEKLQKLTADLEARLQRLEAKAHPSRGVAVEPKPKPKKPARAAAARGRGKKS